MLRLVSLLVLVSCDAPSTDSTDGGRTVDPMDGGSGGNGGDGGDGGYTGGGTMDGGQSGIPCVETEWPLSEVAAPVDLAEIWPIFEGWAPAAITWDRSPIPGQEGTTSPFSVAFVQSGEAVAVTRTGGDPWDCAPGPELRIPVTVSYVVDDGSVTGSYVGNIDAGGTDPGQISANFRDFAPTLSEDWVAVASAQLAEYGWSLDDDIAVANLSMRNGDEWEPEWSLFAADQYEDGFWGQWSSSLWGGYPDP